MESVVVPFELDKGRSQWMLSAKQQNFLKLFTSSTSYLLGQKLIMDQVTIINYFCTHTNIWEIVQTEGRQFSSLITNWQSQLVIKSWKALVDVNIQKGGKYNKKW